MTPASLRALLSGLIDYAGLFPPAQLPLEEAIRNYTSYQLGAEAWMLGRFICPVARLPRLANLAESVSLPNNTFTVSAILGGSEAEVATQLVRGGGRVTVTALEARLSGDAAADSGWIARAQALANTAGAPLTLYLEGPHSNLTMQPGGRLRCGVKMRCGGADAAAFPSPEQVAKTLLACRERGIPFKATAGLHHPLRHRDSNLGVMGHGFLNVFVAGVLAHARGLDEERLRRVVEETDAAVFRFDDAGLQWRELRATTAEIVAARSALVHSFGSCSFDEPRDDLRALGLLA